MKKRIPALLLSVVLCFGMLGTTAYAAKIEPEGKSGSNTILTVSGVDGKRLCALWDSAERNHVILLFYTDSSGTKRITVPTLTAGQSYYIGIQGGDQALYIFPDPENPDLKQHTITFDPNGGSTTGGISVLQTDGDGKLLNMPTAVRANYIFSGWYTEKKGGTQMAEDAAFDGDTTLYARWIPDGSLKYDLEELILHDADTGEALDSIASGDFLAEVTVTNLSSETEDTLFLVTYDKDGKMLDIHCLDVNAQADETDTLETEIQNSDGKAAKIKAFVLSAQSLEPLGNTIERT